MVHVVNGTKVKASVTIFSEPDLFRYMDMSFLNDNSVKPKPSSFAIVHVRRANATRQELKTSQSSVGTRQLGDKLIFFDSKHVTNTSRFPEDAFEFNGGQSITSVQFSFNVSNYLYNLKILSLIYIITLESHSDCLSE